MQKLFGGGGDDESVALARRQAAASQRRALAELARQSAETDQAKAAGGAKPGRSALTFLGASGQASLG